MTVTATGALYTMRMARLITLAVALGLPACATLAPPIPEPQIIPVPVVSENDALLFRIREIRGSSDFGATPGFWSSLWKLVVGDSETSLVRPYGVYADHEGRVTVADPGMGTVHLFDRLSGSYRTIYTAKDYRGKASPIGVTGDGAGTVWFTDSAGERIMRYSQATRELLPFVENIPRPTGIAFNRTTGLIYVAETGSHEIAAYDTSGKEVLRFGGRGDEPGKFNFPTDLCLDALGRIVVTDALNARVQIFTADGLPVHHFGAPGDRPGFFAKPKGIAADARGRLYVADALFDAIQVFDPNGMLILTFGKTGSGPGEFWMPTGIFLDEEGLIYVADSYNRRIQIFRIEITEDEQ